MFMKEPVDYSVG